MDRSFEQQVRQRAYHLWLREGAGRGQVGQHWFQAVRDTLAETALSGVGQVKASGQGGRGHLGLADQPTADRKA